MLINYRRTGRTLVQNIEALMRVNYYNEKICIVCISEESKQRRKKSLLDTCKMLNMENLKLPDVMTMEEYKNRER